MSNEADSAMQSATSVPPDDPQRNLAVRQADGPNLLHIGLVGDTYTTLLSGKDTAERFCLIDMHVPPGGDPLLTATTLKNRSLFSKARSRLSFAEQSPS